MISIIHFNYRGVSQVAYLREVYINDYKWTIEEAYEGLLQSVTPDQL